MKQSSPNQSKRTAGILLHITSLPSAFGIGDMGPAAFYFADQLKEARQHIWQVLPINPVHDEDYSPYSALGSMAGNTMLISPELLSDAGFLKEEFLREFRIPAGDIVDYVEVSKAKQTLLDAAYQAFNRETEHPWHPGFEAYCQRESYWLHDYATFRILSQLYHGKPWQEWKADDRDKQLHPDGDQASWQQKIMWEQFVFDLQWQSLKSYCNKQGIQIFGDLPFYVHGSSADVWANRELFNVDAQGTMLGIAGVPPDYFNSKGQLWNMPTYNWENLRASHYAWWIQRLRRNMEWFDLVRLDHFRAFSAYWEVPAGATDATNGTWEPGPGTDLFEVLKASLPTMPFVAEDLGEIDAAVHELRDRYRFPGMRVLQFGFGKDMPATPHAPHNFAANVFAFTGTHDNNTTRGWFKEEADSRTHKHLMRYIGTHVNARLAPDLLSRMAYTSVANTVILPMQDVLSLPSSARMNTPSQIGDNWSWRLLPGQFSDTHINRLKIWTKCFGRDGK